VSTEKEKTGVKAPPDPNDLKPLRQYKFCTPSSKALKDMRGKIEENRQKERLATENSEDAASGDVAATAAADGVGDAAATRSETADATSEEERNKKPDYNCIYSTCQAICEVLGTNFSSLEDECVGFKLVRMRSAATGISTAMTKAAITSMKSKFENETLPSTTNTKRQYRAKKRKLRIKNDDDLVKRKRAKPTNVKHNGRCCFFGGTCEGSFSKGSTCVPLPPPSPKEMTQGAYRSYGWKTAKRALYLRRSGMTKNSGMKNLRLCKAHNLVKQEVTFHYPKIKDGEFVMKVNEKGETTSDREMITDKKVMLIPEDVGKNDAPRSANKGLGMDRRKRQTLENVDSNLLAVQQQAEMQGTPRKKQCTHSRLNNINPSVLEASKLSVHVEVEAPDCWEEESPEASGNKTAPTRSATVLPTEMTDKQIRTRTGFKSVAMLLCYSILLCDGDLDKWAERSSSLSNFEEWILYFQWRWGRMGTTFEALAELFHVSHEEIRRVVYRKEAQALSTMNRWPRFCSLEEDWALMDAKWAVKYPNERLILWDNSNVNLPCPSDSETSQHTYSPYYKGNVGKGGTYVQPGGWMGTWELFAGAISDSDYQRKSKVFEAQQAFANEDNSNIPFTGMMDKGYRCSTAAWRAGRQVIRQPVFAKSDKKFNSRQVHQIADVATDRSGNERCVNIAKRFGIIKRGMEKRQSTAVIADAWLVSGFQANFMFKKVV
jgi:hypothetical protein